MTGTMPRTTRSLLLAGAGMGAIMVSGAALAQQAGNAIELDQVNVQVAAPESPTGPVQGYVARQTLTGSKTNTPIVEVPQSVFVMTRDQMNAQGAQSVGQALNYTAGVLGQAFGTDPRFDYPILRGFAADNSQYLNGLKLMREAGATSIEQYGLERIDVLLGPSSVLYGQGNPGGLINMVSKRPTFTSFAEVQGQIGSFDRYVGAFDIGGVLGTDVAYRLTGLVRQSGTQTDYVDDNRYYFAPAFTWKPSDDTKLTILANVQHDDAGTPVGLPAAYTNGPGFPNLLSRNLFLGDPSFNSSDRTVSSIGYEFEHKINDTWQVRQNARYLQLNWDYDNLYFSALTSPTEAARGTSVNNEDQNTITIDTQLQGEFMTGQLSHTVLFGLDYRRYSQTNMTQFGTAPSVNVFAPTYNMFIVNNPWYASLVDGTISQAGIYAQDQIKLGGWMLTMGLRQDWAYTTSSTLTNFGNTFQDQDDQALTSRVGLTYLFDNGIAPYVSYSTSFQPVIGNMPVALGGQAFQPSRGEQYELGVKYQPVGWNGFFTAAVYDLTQTNVQSTTLINGVSYDTQNGEVNVKGVELSAKMSLMDGLDLIANYTYMNAEITQGANAGNRPANVPENMANIWLDYTLKSGQFTGFGVGGGVRYIGDRYALDDDSILLHANTLVDAALHYERGPFKAQINLNNIFNETYVASCGFFGCYYGDGRTVLGTVTYKW